MSRTIARLVAALLALALVAAACSSDDSGGGDGPTTTAAAAPRPRSRSTTRPSACGTTARATRRSRPLKIGLMTVFESPVLSLKDQATALEASAEAFNARGGANGSCIEVTTCDDGGNVDQAVACVRTIDDAGVVATVNDQGTAGQADVSAAMADGEDPPGRVERHAGRLGRPERLPARRVRHRRHLPAAAGAHRGRTSTKIGLIRVDLAAASALVGLLEAVRLRGQGDVPLRRPGPGRHHRLQPVHPRRAGRRRRRRDPRPRRAGGHPGRAGRPAARHRPAHRLEPRHVLAHERSPSSATSPKQMVFLVVVPAGDDRPPGVQGAARRPRGIRARRRSSPRTSRPARCARGSASTPCSR